LFKEFELDLPDVTLLVVHGANLCVEYWWLAAPLFGGLLLPAVIVSLLYYVDLLPGDLPLIGRLWRPVDRAATLRMLAWAAERGRPLAETLRQMALVHPRSYFRRVLGRCLARIERGSDWCEALRAERLIRPSDAAVLRAAERAGNLPWALAETAEAALRRFALRLRAAIGVLFPVLILAFGAVVAAVFISLFAPLVELIWRLS
jgi:type II secretory pathway component PulF